MLDGAVPSAECLRSRPHLKCNIPNCVTPLLRRQTYTRHFAHYSKEEEPPMPQYPRLTRPIVELHLRRTSVLVLAAVFAFATFLAGCGSSGGDSGDATSTGTGSVDDSAATASATAEVTKYLTLPTKILQTEKFTPKEGDLVYNVSCNLAIVGCSQISEEIGKATTAMGGRFDKCDAGTTPSQAQSCFTNAVNANANVIVVNGVPVVGAGSGYAQANSAGIPVVGIF